MEGRCHLSKLFQDMSGAVRMEVPLSERFFRSVAGDATVCSITLANTKTTSEYVSYLGISLGIVPFASINGDGPLC